MIKNEKQYRITKAQIRRFQDALTEMASQARPANISPGCGKPSVKPPRVRCRSCKNR
jgi:hypothetical protein